MNETELSSPNRNARSPNSIVRIGFPVDITSRCQRFGCKIAKIWFSGVNADRPPQATRENQDWIYFYGSAEFGVPGVTGFVECLLQGPMPNCIKGVQTRRTEIVLQNFRNEERVPMYYDKQVCINS